MPVILMPGKWKLEEQKLKVVFRCTASSGLARNSLDPVSENKINSGNTMGLLSPVPQKPRVDFIAKADLILSHRVNLKESE